MVRRSAPLVALLCLMLFGPALAVERPSLKSFTLGGRFEYMTLIERDASAFPWNAATRSSFDRTRVMVDLSSLDTRYGDLYVKGAASWGAVRPADLRKRLRLDQADYFWHYQDERVSYSTRLFVNERRFFVSDLGSPLLNDDLVESAGENRGIRIDSRLHDRIDVTALYSLLGDDSEESRRVAYLRAGYSRRWAAIAASYLFDDLGAHAPRNHAVFKSEVSSAFRKLFVVLSYVQSDFKEGTVFFPSATFHWSRYNGDNFSSTLPDGGAVSAEARVRPVRIGEMATLRFVYKYGARGRSFVNDLGDGGGAVVGHTAATYFGSRNVSLNGRLLYRNAVRFGLEREAVDRFEAGVWGDLRNGTGFLVRGRIERTEDALNFDSRRNFIHLALERSVRKLRTSAHIMWKDLDTIHSEQRLALDGQLALSPDWGLHWRTVFGRDYDVAQAVFTRLEYRPNDRIFATVSYGRDFIGDGPFLLEDRDIDSQGTSDAIYRFSIRGDF